VVKKTNTQTIYIAPKSNMFLRHIRPRHPHGVMPTRLRLTGRMTKTFCPTFDKQSQIVDRIVCELLLFRAVWSGPLSTPSHSCMDAYISTRRQPNKSTLFPQVVQRHVIPPFLTNISPFDSILSQQHIWQKLPKSVNVGWSYSGATLVSFFETLCIFK